MQDSQKTKAQLLEELESLRSRVAASEQTAPGVSTLQQSDVLPDLYAMAPIGLCVLDTEMRYVFINEWLANINGLSVEQHVGRTIGEVLPAVAAGVKSQLRRVIETGEPIIEGMIVAETPAHPEIRRHFQHSYLPVRSNDGTIVGISCVVQEVTDREKAEEALVAKAESERLLLRELNHRVRNNLASLIYLIDLSRSHTDDAQTLAESIKGRVQTMAKVHSALSREAWRAVELRTLLRALMDTGFDGHIKFDGPAVAVPAGQAQAAGLVINELATNSHKYGAMGKRDGMVEVTWDAHRDQSGAWQVLIRWLESGGPPIEAEPKPGTGMELIRSLVEIDLRGQVEFRFPSQGADHAIAITLSEGSTAQFEVVADSV